MNCDISKNTVFTEHLWTTASAGLKRKVPFLRKQGNSTKERHIIPGKYVNLYQNTVSNFARLPGKKKANYTTQEGKLLTEHLILSKCPDFVLPRAPQIPRQKYTSEHLFHRTVSSDFCQMSVIS